MFRARTLSLVIVVVLLAAGGLSLWDSIFTHNSIHGHLSELETASGRSRHVRTRAATEVTASMIQASLTSRTAGG
jgi:hypothetical protein